jgi:hypothetical protein
MVYYTPYQGIPTTAAFYSLDDFYAVIGGENWVLARRTLSIVASYGEDVICLSPKAYRNAQRLAHLRRTEGFG